MDSIEVLMEDWDGRTKRKCCDCRKWFELTHKLQTRCVTCRDGYRKKS